jgi:hypothetical protein
MVLGQLLGACIRDQRFTYHLQTETLTVGAPSPLSIQVGEAGITFEVTFQGGAGENETARLEEEGSTLRVLLLNRDSRAQEMLVLYHLTGSIRDLEAGSYTLEVQDSTDRVVAHQTFRVP